jgi:pyruvate/2-oxoglutarate dehydrogenase complex dihydrolipoamide acyltransferase (E2) component
VIVRVAPEAMVTPGGEVNVGGVVVEVADGAADAADAAEVVVALAVPGAVEAPAVAGSTASPAPPERTRKAASERRQVGCFIDALPSPSPPARGHVRMRRHTRARELVAWSACREDSYPAFTRP